MKNRLTIGDTRSFNHVVIKEDLATFDTGNVHPVCSTFALAKYIEWTSRKFIVDIKRDNEEGIGTFLKLEHLSPALIKQELKLKATVISINKNRLLCAVLVTVNGRVVASAQTGQKLMRKDKIQKIFSSLESKA